jgi:hypothetical protein
VKEDFVGKLWDSSMIECDLILLEVKDTETKIYLKFPHIRSDQIINYKYGDHLKFLFHGSFENSDDIALPILYTCTWLSLLPYKFTETSENFHHTTRSQIPEN